MTDRTEISDLMGGLITEELKQAYMNAAPILYEVKVDAPAGTPAYLAHPVSKFMDRAANAINAFSAGALSIYEGESLSNLLIITRGATNTLREP